MKIEQIDSSKVMILLGCDDMKDFSLEYETLGFTDPHSRRILSRLLKLACTKTGMSVNNKRMYVEALPHKSGCLILLTLTEKRSRRIYRIKKSDKSCCCVFDDVEALIRASAALKKFQSPDGSVYFTDGKYYLIIDTMPLSLYYMSTLEEYSTAYVCSKPACARIAENGKALGSIKTMGRFFN
ncbi:MAG: adaptor protein MecA [Ruminococcus sp.]|jgi:negative regulator of genetic competence, sporulation and motility|nr:adaptor protein MecA [Ruminococcus sp.]